MMPNELLTLQHLHSDSATGFEPRWRLPAALTLPPPSPLHTQPASRLGPFAQTKAEIVDSNQLDRDPTPHPPFPNENLKDTKHSNMLGSNVKVWRESNRVGAYLEGRLLRRSAQGNFLPWSACWVWPVESFSLFPLRLHTAAGVGSAPPRSLAKLLSSDRILAPLTAISASRAGICFRLCLRVRFSLDSVCTCARTDSVVESNDPPSGEANQILNGF
jgi:hypothetical protein